MTQAAQLDTETKKKIIELVSNPETLKQILNSEDGQAELMTYAEADPDIAAALEKGLAKLANENSTEKTKDQSKQIKQQKQDRPRENNQQRQENRQERKPDSRPEQRREQPKQQQPQRQERGGENQRVGKGKKGKGFLKYLGFFALGLLFVLVVAVAGKYLVGMVPTPFRNIVLTVLIVLGIAAAMLAGVFEFLTEPPGSSIALAFAAGYCFLINIEGYYQAMPGTENIAFVPKLFIDDNANPFLLASPKLWGDPKFIIAIMIALMVQLLQAYFLRLLDKVRETSGRDLSYKDVAMKWGVIVAISYICDFSQALTQYPLLGQKPTTLFRNVCYVIVSVFASEFLYNLMIQSQDEKEISRRGQYRGALN